MAEVCGDSSYEEVVEQVKQELEKAQECVIARMRAHTHAHAHTCMCSQLACTQIVGQSCIQARAHTYMYMLLL